MNTSVTLSDPSSTPPPAALREYTSAAKADLLDGVPLAELLNRVNRVAVVLVNEDDHAESKAGRVKRMYSERSFRHYQTLGCIDVPDKRGRLANYGFRHFLQALLVRKLLWERLPAEQIATMLVGRGTEELERMLLGGVEIVARGGGGGGDVEQPESATSPAERWNRVLVAPGVELHLNADLPRYKPVELLRMMQLLEKVLRRHGM